MNKIEELINTNEFVIIDLYTSWCNPCKVLSKTLSDINIDNVSIYKIDIEEDNDLSIELNIKSVPTLLYYKNGVQINRTTGAISKEQILTNLK